MSSKKNTAASRDKRTTAVHRSAARSNKLPASDKRDGITLAEAAAPGFFKTSRGQAIKKAMATLFAEAEAGKISVCFQDDDPDRCVLWAGSGVFLLELTPGKPGRTFEFKPEDYNAPTAADIQRMIKSA